MSRAWIIAYDIADPRRLQQVHRRMSKHAAPLQFSVFWLEGSERDRAHCIHAVLPLLACDKDDLRVYSVPARGLRIRLGPEPLPEGILWTGMAARGWNASLAAALERESSADPEPAKRMHSAADDLQEGAR